MPRWRRPSFREAREATPFLLGTVVILHELFIYSGDERPTLILVGAGLITGTILVGSGRNNGNGNGDGKA